jgi:hypothetical protein
MAFGPESTNPREMRAYAHTMINHLAEGEVNYGEALQAAWRGSLTVKGVASGFEGALEHAADSVKVEEQGASGHRTIRRVPLNWEHPKDKEGNYLPLFDTREATGGTYSLSELSELVEDGVSPNGLKSWFMPAFGDVPEEQMGVSLYEITTEGTPLTPVFPDTIEGHRALAEHAAESATICGSEKASAEYWQTRLFGTEEEVTSPDESQAWDMAHDEKYRREGKTGFLKNPIETQLLAGTHKTEVIDNFYNAYLKGVHVTAKFNDDRMSSREIGELGIDGAYIKYFGLDREGYKERDRLDAAQYEQDEVDETKRALEEVPELVEQTADIVNPDLADKWRQVLEIRATDLYHGGDSRSAISLMRAHSQGASQAELRQLMDEHGHSGASASMTMAMIQQFYKAGDGLAEMLS